MAGESKVVPYVPASAPFSAEQRAWLNGYLAGLFSYASGEVSRAESALQPSASQLPLLVLYGSQTGTAEALAKKIGQEAVKHGYQARALEMSRYAELNLQTESRLLVVTSTWGDGDPPDNATAFWNFLCGQTGTLPNLNFAVLGLGDRNYPSFCGAAKKFDERFEQLGACRICARAECDVDYETSARVWLESFWSALKGPGVPQSSPIVEAMVESEPGLAKKTYSRSNPFKAVVLANRNLNANGSAKETRHLEFSLEGSDLTYEPGDALGVVPANCPDLVGKIIAALGCDGEEAVPDSCGNETSLRNALLKHYQITAAPMGLLEEIANRSQNPELMRLLNPANKTELDAFLNGRDVLDLLEVYRLTSPIEFVALLRKLQPRLYSISSSLKAHPNEVHITVGALRYESHGRARKGVCSIFLAERLSPGATVPIYFQPSHGFKLPADPGIPIIMVGPGTGIAPFRAFLEERQGVGASGKNWLFFGDQHAADDFLYREELEAMQKGGYLTRLETAFSRDQSAKLYVQHRMLEHARELCDWIEEGAHFYVCGDARRMARDVDAALHEVIARGLGKSADAAAEYVTGLKTAKRYQRDVY